MKKLFLGFVSLTASFLVCLSLIGCVDRKSAQDVSCEDSLSKASDSIESQEELLEETPMPKAADELFDDFFFNFMSRKDVQMARIKFPLAVEEGRNTRTLQHGEWKREWFFRNQDFYTLLLDNQAQMALAKDTTVSKAVVEKIFLEKQFVKQFCFERINGEWLMTKVKNVPASMTHNASFIDFYQKFVTDSDFQVSSINEELEFSGPDPDDELNNIEGIILPEQFPAFTPPLPHGVIYNIIYGEPKRGSNTKVFMVEGISNGVEWELVFRRVSGKWKLYKVSM